jgi:hypothetical protein
MMEFQPMVWRSPGREITRAEAGAISSRLCDAEPHMPELLAHPSAYAKFLGQLLGDTKAFTNFESDETLGDGRPQFWQPARSAATSVPLRLPEGTLLY